jgi:ribosomal small subunit protein bTHX
MGKGDQSSRRGKIHRGTYGKRRPKPGHHTGPKPGVAAEAATAKEKSKEAKVVKKQTPDQAS